MTSAAKSIVSRAPRQSGSEVLRVVLGEDTLVARTGISALIDGIEGLELVATGANPDEIRAAIDRAQPDVLLSDIRMPPGYSDEGIQLAVELRTTHPQLGVVVLSQHAEPQYATALFAAGANGRGYLLKDQLREPEELARALREVASGGALVDPRVVDTLLAARYSPVGQTLSTLTQREREILSLIAAAHTNRAIAQRVGITRRGVERHINAIFAKLELGQADEVSPRVKAALLFLSSEGRLDVERLG
jgi:DNA-binding NarL/FixJ family response regulator